MKSPLKNTLEGQVLSIKVANWDKNKIFYL